MNYKVFKEEMTNKGHKVSRKENYIYIVPENGSEGFQSADDVIKDTELFKMCLHDEAELVTNDHFNTTIYKLSYKINICSYLIDELLSRDIKIEYGKNYAQNFVRFFVYKGQKIYFDSERSNGGTFFEWNKSTIKNLLFILDHVESFGQSVYYKIEGELCFSFDWGYKEYLLPSQFSGSFGFQDGKLYEFVK